MTTKEKNILREEGWNTLELSLKKGASFDEQQLKQIAVGGRDEVPKHEYKAAYQIGRKAYVIYRRIPVTENPAIPAGGCKTCGNPGCPGDCPEL